MTELWFPTPADVMRDPRVTTLPAEAFGALVRLYGTARGLGSPAVVVPGMPAAELLEHVGVLARGRGEVVLDLLEGRGLVGVDGPALRPTIGWPLPAARTPAAPVEAPAAHPATAPPRPATRRAAPSGYERDARQAVTGKLSKLRLRDAAARVAWVESDDGAEWCGFNGIAVELALSVARRDHSGRFGTVMAGDAHGDGGGDGAITRTVMAHHRDGDGGGDGASSPCTPSEREFTGEIQGIENDKDTPRTVMAGDAHGDGAITGDGDAHGDGGGDGASPGDGSGASAPLVLLPTDRATKKVHDVEKVFAHWQSECGHPRAVLDPKRRTLIARALKTWSVDDLCRSVDGYARSAWHRGENDRGQRYDGLDLILRDAAHVERGWELEATAREAEAPAGSAADDPWSAGLRDLKAMTAARQQRAAGEVAHG